MTADVPRRTSPQRRRPRTAALLAATCVSGLAVLLGAAGARAQTVAPADAEQVFVQRVNALRAAQGLGALRVDAMLTGVARQWAAELSRTECVCHHPEFQTGNPDDAAEVIPGNWVKIGENVGTGSNAEQIEDAFERSPGHRKNILDPAFDSVGIGVVVVNGAMWVSQQFQDLPAGEEAAALRRVSSNHTDDAPDGLALGAPATTVAKRRATPSPTSPTPTTRPRATASAGRRRGGKVAAKITSKPVAASPVPTTSAPATAPATTATAGRGAGTFRVVARTTA